MPSRQEGVSKGVYIRLGRGHIIEFELSCI